MPRIAPVFSIIGLLFCSACSSDESGATGGKRVILHTVVQADAGVAEAFTTGTHWNVRLTSAALSIGSLYYFDGAPAFAQLTPPPRPLLQRVQQLFVGVAHAHPQHYVAGNALGQMTSRSSADLFAGRTELPDGEGVTGTYRSGRLLLPDRNDGPFAEALAGHVVVAAGVAQKDDKIVHFRAFTDLGDIQKTSPAGEIDGSAFDEVTVESDGTIMLTVTPKTWFNLVDFSEVEPGREDEPTELTPGEAAYIGFALGVAQLSAYRYSFSP